MSIDNQCATKLIIKKIDFFKETPYSTIASRLFTLVFLY